MCNPCREKLETLQVDAYQESLQEADETADCMARMIYMHKNIVGVQAKLDSALPEVCIVCCYTKRDYTSCCPPNPPPPHPKKTNKQTNKQNLKYMKNCHSLQANSRVYFRFKMYDMLYISKFLFLVFFSNIMVLRGKLNHTCSEQVLLICYLSDLNFPSAKLIEIELDKYHIAIKGMITIVLHLKNKNKKQPSLCQP